MIDNPMNVYKHDRQCMSCKVHILHTPVVSSPFQSKHIHSAMPLMMSTIALYTYRQTVESIVNSRKVAANDSNRNTCHVHLQPATTSALRMTAEYMEAR